jgi:2-keto-4-pentenoate hydratase
MRLSQDQITAAADALFGAETAGTQIPSISATYPDARW